MGQGDRGDPKKKYGAKFYRSYIPIFLPLAGLQGELMHPALAEHFALAATCGGLLPNPL